MSGPLPLRLWCLAAMAPALTDAATQARAKLTVNLTSAAEGQRVGIGRTDCASPVSELQPATIASPGPSKPVPQLVSLARELMLPTNLDPGIPQNLAQGKTLSHSTTHLSNPVPVVKTQGGVTKPTILIPLTTKNNGIRTTVDQKAGMNGPTSGSGIGQSNGGTQSVTGIATSQSTMPIQGTLSQLVIENNGVPGMGLADKSQLPSTSSQGAPPISNAPLGIATLTDPGVQSSELSDAGELHYQEIGDGGIIQSSVNQGAGMAEVGVLSNVDLVAEAKKRQRELERRAARLTRRLRCLQSRQTVAHVQKQLSGLVDHQHKNLQNVAKSIKVQPTNLDLKTELLQSDDVKSLSTAALVNLVRKLQSNQQAMSLRQRLSTAVTEQNDSSSILKLDEDLCVEMNRVAGTLTMNLHHLEEAVDDEATESSSGGESCDEGLDYDEDKLHRHPLHRRCEWKWAMERAAVAARWTWLQAQVSDLEYRIRQQTDIYRQIRAAKGAVVLGEAPQPQDLVHSLRAAPRPGGRKLTPLEEKIANLERKNTEMSPCNLSTLLSNVDKQSSKLTQQLGNIYSPISSPLVRGKPLAKASSTTPNGMVEASTSGGHDVTPEASDNEGSEPKKARTEGESGVGTVGLHFDPPSPCTDTSCTAARCRPVQSYGKRRLLRTAGLHQVSRKAARLSSVRCHCFPPTTPCAICGGRYNNTQTLHPATMPFPERVALLDPSYHPVLSFSQDVPLPVHFESLLKSGEWQHKPPPKTYKPLPHPERKSRKYMPDHVRKYKKRLSKSASAAVMSSVKFRSAASCSCNGAFAGTSHHQCGHQRATSSASEVNNVLTRKELRARKRKAQNRGLGSLRKRSRSGSVTSMAGPSGSGSSGGHHQMEGGFALAQSCPASTLKEMKESLRRRRGESAFDINNIVIPYSMAASTRVEKLKYKEILTPKWRKIEEDSLTNRLSGRRRSGSVSSDSGAAATTSCLVKMVKLDLDNHKLDNNHRIRVPTPTNNLTRISIEKLDEEEEGQDGLDNQDQHQQEEDKTQVAGEEPTSEVKSEAESELAAAGVKEISQGPNGLIPIKQELDEEIEDLSDELIAERHLRCEKLERIKFAAALNNHKRSRAPRTESMTSQASQDDGDSASVLQTPPTTPASGGDKAAGAVEEVAVVEESRKRSGSCSSRPGDDLSRSRDEVLMRDHARSRSNSSSRLRGRSLSIGDDKNRYEPYNEVAPWERRTFPLCDDDFNNLFREPEKRQAPSSRVVTMPTQSKDSINELVYDATPEDSEPSSPLHSSSSDIIEDDPDDPEWTVVKGNGEAKPVVKTPGLVLRLAKR